MDPADYAQFFLALLFVLGLIGLGAAALRRFGPGGMAVPRPRHGPRRLMLVETLALDPRRRVVLVRRDDTEHLLLLGPQNDSLIEGGIDAPADSPATGQEAGESVVKRFDAVVRRIGRATQTRQPDVPPTDGPKREDSA